jgi:tRNA A-37 threonylcarbamoyl transferase component Bud32
LTLVRARSVDAAAHPRQGALAAASRRALNPARVVDDALVPGSLISGRFRLQKLLGRGGMASVWQAAHLTLDTDVAIKFLEPRWSSSGEILARFAREATAIARIRSPHVVQVLDHGFTENGRGFIVMELLQGEDLGRRLARAGKLGLKETAALVSQVCRGLGKAHAAQIIHRDIKPENLFLVQEEEGAFVKLLDFGVAKATGVGDATHQTDTGQLVGTPLYMSPEQALGRTIDTRCDLYSLATVAYRCVTGRSPFVEKHVGELLVAISTIVPPAASSLESTVPCSLDAWFASMFSKDPSARCCQTARELASSFEAACRGVSPTSATLAGTAAVSVEAATQPGDPDGRAWLDSMQPGRDATPSPALEQPPRRSVRTAGRRAWVAVTLLGIGVALIGLALWPRPSREPPSAAAPPTALLALEGQPAAPPTIETRFAVRPSTAALFLDGRPLPANPYTGTEPADKGKHRLRAEAAGHVPLEIEVTFESDVRLELSLDPLPPSPSTLSERPGRPSSVIRSVTKNKDAAHDVPASERPSSESPRTEPGDERSPGKRLELDRSSPWRPP